MREYVLLGDEAVSLGAIHAGVSAAYAYPGTPSTEVMEYLVKYSEQNEGNPIAQWTANEKTAVEEIMGTSLAGKRAITSMKHVGLNVAADPLMNASLIQINGGVVIVVADDPGMHSSQNEQDTRLYADFSRIMCFEPATQQEAYDMTREAFDISEQFKVPVIIRLVTRMAHSRAVVATREHRGQNKLSKAHNATTEWNLLPPNARALWRKLLDKQKVFANYSEGTLYNSFYLSNEDKGLGVITTGVARNYYFENVKDLGYTPSHLHISVYPYPVEKIRKLAAQVDRLLVIEEGYPYVERYLRGILPNKDITILGKESGELPLDGELTPETVRKALGMEVKCGLSVPQDLKVSARPPQLCAGCPHADSFELINEALEGYENKLVTTDIGCYTLGAYPPYSAVETCLCMGASIGMARGAADAGLYPVVAVIGDSTFLHSGITGLMDALSTNSNMTLVILDNSIVAMTGAQPTIVSSQQLQDIVKAVGINPEHMHVLPARKSHHQKNLAILKQEIEYNGLSVIITERECLEKIKRKK